MISIPVDKKFAILCEITRAQHFAWREAVRRTCPEIDPTIVVEEMWELTGQETARAYLKRLDWSRPLPAQIAGSIVWSSQCMGEDAGLEVTENSDEAFVRHRSCPWFQWHERRGLLAEDRKGCDRWFQSMVDAVNAASGGRLRFETLGALPDGDTCCLRRFWVEEER